MAETLDWIGVDWGTSNVRCWGLTAGGEVLFSTRSDKGMRTLKTGDYPGVLDELVGNNLPDRHNAIPVIVCGMAGAREGWREASYLPVPVAFADLDRQGTTVPSDDPRFDIRILPGLCQREAGVEDVMRGEETQLLGLHAIMPDFSGAVCMPGTHSKWVRCDTQKVISFHTAMTGELFEILRTQSVLRHSMPEEAIGAETEAGIADGMSDGLAQPERLISRLFRTRAASLLSGKSPHWCFGYLSGLLVGAEVGGMSGEIDGSPVALIGSARLCRLYGAAFKSIGVDTVTIEGEKAVLAGLGAARKALHG